MSEQSLDLQLDSYHTCGAAFLETKERTRFVGKVAIHSAAVGAALAMAPSAEAAVIYSGIQNVTLTHPGGTNSNLYLQGIDLDFLGGPDVRLGVDRDSGGTYQAYLTALVPAQAVLASGGFVQNLGTGALIGPGDPNLVPGYAFPYLNNGSSGNFVGTTGFAGVRFDRAGNSHFAWLRIQVSSSGDSINVIDWAWEDVANVGILAGSLTSLAPVPEPTTASLLGLGLLAAGARGVRGLRRARKAAAGSDAPA